MPHAAQRGINQIAMIFHIHKTVSLAAALLRDARVHWFPKLLFLGSIGALLLALFFPEMLGDIVGLSIPGVGPILDLLGIPVDASIDWVAFAVAAYNLLKVFPAEIVGEHYDNLFHPSRAA